MKEIQKTRDGHQYFICCFKSPILDLLSAAFSEVNDIRSHECGSVKGVPYVPRLNFKPFHVAISEGSHVAVGISSKGSDREDICSQTLFLFFPHTPCFPLRARVIHTPRFPHPAFSRLPVCRSGTLAPRFPPSRNGHDFTGGFA